VTSTAAIHLDRPDGLFLSRKSRSPDKHMVGQRAVFFQSSVPTINQGLWLPGNNPDTGRWWNGCTRASQFTPDRAGAVGTTSWSRRHGKRRTDVRHSDGGATGSRLSGQTKIKNRPRRRLARLSSIFSSRRPSRGLPAWCRNTSGRAGPVVADSSPDEQDSAGACL